MTHKIGNLAFRAIAFAVGATAVSFFMGGVRYPFGVSTFPKMWIQLACNFLIYAVVFFSISFLFEWIRIKNSKTTVRRSLTFAW